MKTITINGKDYNLEFTFEAALYGDCTEAVAEFMVESAKSANSGDIDRMVRNCSDVPQKCLTMFYASLLENHRAEVRVKDDAKALLKQYMKESDNKNFFDVLTMLIGIMGEDGFLAQSGLEQLLTGSEEETETEKKPKTKKKVSES